MAAKRRQVWMTDKDWRAVQRAALVLGGKRGRVVYASEFIRAAAAAAARRVLGRTVPGQLKSRKALRERSER